MNSIEDSPLIKEAIASCHYYWKAGWGEFHAGNLSYLLDEGELAQLSEFFLPEPVRVPVDFDTCGLVGRSFLVTRTGGSFRTIPDRASRDLGVIRVVDNAYEILWGLSEGQGRPTSELPAHLLCHASRLSTGAKNRIVMHVHPTYINAMTTLASLDEREFTKELWRLNSECIVVFPEGLGVLPWMVCGEGPIGPGLPRRRVALPRNLCLRRELRRGDRPHRDGREVRSGLCERERLAAPLHHRRRAPRPGGALWAQGRGVGGLTWIRWT